MTILAGGGNRFFGDAKKFEGGVQGAIAHGNLATKEKFRLVGVGGDEEGVGAERPLGTCGAILEEGVEQIELGKLCLD